MGLSLRDGLRMGWAEDGLSCGWAELRMDGLSFWADDDGLG